MPGGASLDFLSVEVPFDRDRYIPFVLVRYAVDGQLQDLGLRLDLDKQTFADHFGNPAQEAVLTKASLAIVNIVAERLRRLIYERLQSGVVFSLYELRQELKVPGHERTFQDLVHALNVLAHSILTIKPRVEGEAQITAACLPSLVAVSRAKLQTDPKAKWQVQFHPLVTASIDRLDYRQHNYHLSMSLTTQLARWLNKQLVLKYTSASLTNPFEMHYSTIRRGSHLLDRYGRARDAIAVLDQAFQELKDRDVLMHVERSDMPGPRGRLNDVTFRIMPSTRFVGEVKAANRRLLDAKRSEAPNSVILSRGSR